ncbi:nucleotidyltransferase family protein [Massilia sp. W12]|uniref:N-acetylmuramate alpha-1-phosphate uridylyltransferase MurU n=1 Tax=Massilia sp. W12 TaxID=3126507 RepID=UPI0030D02984
MKAMILAAGRGERMRPLTEHTPKPLLEVRGRPLIVWHILNLVRAGIKEIVINLHYKGAMIADYLGDGSRYGAKLRYSHESELLETAGGIVQALPLLGEAPFVCIAADVYCPHFEFEQAKTVLQDADMWGKPYAADERDIGWLFMTKNPPHHPQGDFGMKLYSICNQGEHRFTFTGIGVYRPEMFAGLTPGQPAKLVSLFQHYAELGVLGGEVYPGIWTDVGTPERLQALNAQTF